MATMSPAGDKAVQNRVADAFKEVEFEIVSTNLSKDQEDQLCEAFGA